MTPIEEGEFDSSKENLMKTSEEEIENDKEILGEVGDNIIDDMIKDYEKEGIRQEDFEIPISEEQREKLWKKITSKVNEIKEKLLEHEYVMHDFYLENICEQKLEDLEKDLKRVKTGLDLEYFLHFGIESLTLENIREKVRNFKKRVKESEENLLKK